MGYVNYTLRVLAALFIFIVITKIFMAIANYIGEQFGFGKLFISLWEKLRKK